MTDLASLQARVHGRVQGVYFRAFTCQQAKGLGLTGFVRNLPDGQTVEVKAEGERTKLGKLIEQLNIGPPKATVEKVETSWSEYTGGYSDFSVRQ